MSRLPHLSKRIEEKTADYHSGGPILIVALGDSVTMGATVSGTLIPNDVYHARLKRMLEQRYPKAIFSVINAGIGGETASQGLARVERDVLHHQPDLVIIGFGLNDAAGGPEDTHAFETHLADIIAPIRQHTQADIILLTPNWMNTRAEQSGSDMGLTNCFAELSARFCQIQTSGKLANYAQAIRRIGQQHTIPIADVYQQWLQLAQSGTDIMSLLANRLNHPVASAHQIAADAIFKIITESSEHP